MNAEEFGSMVPVCTGVLRVNGRDAIVGEHVPEVWDWKPHVRQMHVSMGNLSFVNREQAKEMGAIAEKTKIDAAVKDAEIKFSKLDAAHKSLTERLRRMDVQRDDLVKQVKQAAKLAGDAEMRLRRVRDGEAVELDPEPEANRLADVRGAEVAEVMVDKEKTKAEAKDRLNKVMENLGPHPHDEVKRGAESREHEKREMPAPDELAIREKYLNMAYGELHRVAQEEFGLGSGRYPKAKLQEKVIAAAMAKFKDDADLEVATSAIKSEGEETKPDDQEPTADG